MASNGQYNRRSGKKGIVIPKIVASGPDNPLGPFAMRLGNPNYLIHGNNDPTGVGFRISGGCIHMFNQDIENCLIQSPLEPLLILFINPLKPVGLR